MNTVTNAILNFRCDLESLKILRDWKDEDLADRLKISVRTLRRVKQDPMSASGKTVLLIQEMLKQEKMKQYK